MHKKHRLIRWLPRLPIAAMLGSTFLLGGCFGLELDSAIVQRFRAAYAPGLAAGLQTAVLEPGDAEVGLRQAWAALMDGIAAAVALRDSDP